MRLVTGRIASVIEVHVALAVTLGNLGGHETVFLLGIGIVDKTLLRLEVERHGVGLIGVRAHLEHRSTEFLSRRVQRTCGMYQTGVKRHIYLVTLQVHILILHM